MPVLGYILWVGGGLLALLFVADLQIPRQPPRTEVPHSYNIHIESNDRDGPKAIAFSGETRSFGPPPAMTVVDFAARKPAPSQSEGWTEAHAQSGDKPPETKAAAKPVRKKVAKRKVGKLNDFARVPDEWRRDRYTGDMGMSFARPFFW